MKGGEERVKEGRSGAIMVGMVNIQRCLKHISRKRTFLAPSSSKIQQKPPFFSVLVRK